ncbi:MAG: hypothetical protein V7K50_21145 [Nostoc sp.]
MDGRNWHILSIFNHTKAMADQKHLPLEVKRDYEKGDNGYWHKKPE